MLGDYSNTIVYVFESISQFFVDLSRNTSESMCDEGGVRNRFKKSLYLTLGAGCIILYGIVGVILGIFSLLGAVLLGICNIRFVKGASIRVKELVNVCTVCGLIFMTVFLLNKAEWAKEENRYYLDRRNDINEACHSGILQVNTLDSDQYIYHLRNVVESNKTSDQVSSMRAQVGDALPEGLHFATISDYLVTLLVFEQYETIKRCAQLDFFVDSKERGNAGLFHKHLENMCKTNFCSGWFYRSDECLDLILDFANNSTIRYSRPHYNNSFYLMRLFNENIEDRYASSHRENAILMSIVKDVDYIDYMQEGDSSSSYSKHENEIFEYLSCVKMFRAETDEYLKECSTDRFLQIYQATTSDILKQYSLYMALRSYAEPYGRLMRNGSISGPEESEVLSKWQFIENLCNDEITYPYLLNTMAAYTQAEQL